MVGKSIMHKADGSIGLITEYHAIPDNVELTGIIRAIFPTSSGSTPEHRTYVECAPVRYKNHGNTGGDSPGGDICLNTNEYEIVDKPNS